MRHLKLKRENGGVGPAKLDEEKSNRRVSAAAYGCTYLNKYRYVCVSELQSIVFFFLFDFVVRLHAQVLKVPPYSTSSSLSTSPPQLASLTLTVL